MKGKREIKSFSNEIFLIYAEHQHELHRDVDVSV